MDESLVNDLAATRRVCDMINDNPTLIHQRNYLFLKDFVQQHSGDNSDDEEAPPDDDEEAPPPLNVEDATPAHDNNNDKTTPEINELCLQIVEDPSSRAYVDRATAYFNEGLTTQALADANKAVELNPDSARALRLRARVRHIMNDNTGAYVDMSEAQKIDYSEEYDTLHTQMKTDREADALESSSSTPPPNMGGTMPDLSHLMSNPAFMNMAQNMMSNPEFMKGIFADLQKNRV